jgi:hypothetical protein
MDSFSWRGQKRKRMISHIQAQFFSKKKSKNDIDKIHRDKNPFPVFILVSIFIQIVRWRTSSVMPANTFFAL